MVEVYTRGPFFSSSEVIGWRSFLGAVLRAEVEDEEEDEEEAAANARRPFFFS